MKKQEAFLAKETKQKLRRINTILAESVLIGAITFEEAANTLLHVFGEVRNSIHGGGGE